MPYNPSISWEDVIGVIEEGAESEGESEGGAEVEGDAEREAEEDLNGLL